MKRILITGAGSYIGTNVERYLMEYNAAQGREIYRVDTLSLRDLAWGNYDFSPYDTVLHMAGKAHADISHVSEEVKQEYYEVNCELAVRTAEKAKKQGVPQFVYLSSVIVYGDSAKVGKKKLITADTPVAPANFYGDSKWQAEENLRRLEGDDFRVALVRPPMVYGKGSKGNFPLLVKIADTFPFFPAVGNERSMIYVGNLAEFLRLLTESGQGGIYLPQNPDYVTTAEMVKAIGAAKGKKIRLLKVLNPLVKLASLMPGKLGGLANKAFGSLTIDKGFDTDNPDNRIIGYQIFDLEKSIQESI